LEGTIQTYEALRLSIEKAFPGDQLPDSFKL